MKTETLHLSDIDIAYCKNGEGPPLLLIHGNSGSKKTFREYQRLHFTSWHTFAIDSRGHGESRSKDEVITIRQMSIDIIRFCEMLEIEEAYVVGYSDGGNIGLYLGLLAPHLFKKIIAISPNYLVEGSKDTVLRIFRGLLRCFLFLKMFRLPVSKFILRLNLMLVDIGLTDTDLRLIRTSMRILCAENDLIKREHMEGITQLIPKCKLVEIKRCNHLNIVNQKETIEAIKSFFMETIESDNDKT